MKSGRVTIKDVAAACGVSSSCVGYILSGSAKYKFKPETAALVRQTATAMKYHCDQVAEAMRSGKMKVIAFIAPCFSPEYTSRIITGTLGDLNSHGYYLKLVELKSPARLDDIVDSCASNRVAGAICNVDSIETTEALAVKFAKFGIPMAAVPFETDNPDIISVATDEAGGLAAAVGHLHSLGHRDIAHFTNAPQSVFSRRRTAAFVEAARRLGVRDDLVFSLADGGGDYDGMRRRSLDLLASREFSGVTCVSDYVAAFVLDAARKLRLDIPAELSVVGYANLNLAMHAAPPLTTVIEPYEAMGEVCSEKLMKRILTPELFSETDRQTVLKLELIERASTCARKRE